jgi:hypothetical protein
MGKRGIVFGIVFVAGIALLVLSGCATQERSTAVARLTESDVRPPALPADLVGTWSGSYGSFSTGGGSPDKVGNFTLTIKDDGTYTAIERRGASTRTYSGVVVANGRTITLRNSSGGWASLVHRGDTLYGLVPDRMSGYTLQVSVSKDSGALAGPASPPSGRQ